jgi:hypothetical protein
LPRFDSDAVFAALLGDPSNGTGNVPQTLSHASLVNARFRTRRWSTRAFARVAGQRGNAPGKE